MKATRPGPSQPPPLVMPSAWPQIVMLLLVASLVAVLANEHGRGLIDRLFPPSAKPEPIPAHLVVLLDVSTSLQDDDVRSGADLAFQYIRSDAFPQRGLFTVYVLDRDFQRNHFGQGTKALARNPEERQQMENLLAEDQKSVNDKVGAYVSKYKVRNATCLMAALVAVPHLFQPGITDQRVLFVSDMVEDCQNDGAPPTSREMAERIRKAADRPDLPVLTGVKFFAAVPKGQGQIPIEWVRQPWTKLLASRGAPDFQIGVIEQLIQQPNPLNSQARP